MRPSCSSTSRSCRSPRPRSSSASPRAPSSRAARVAGSLSRARSWRARVTPDRRPPPLEGTSPSARASHLEAAPSPRTAGGAPAAAPPARTGRHQERRASVVMRGRHPDDDVLADLAADVLPVAEARAVEAHVMECEHCSRLLSDAERIRGLLLSGDPGPMPPDVWARIEAALARRRRGSPRQPVGARAGRPHAGGPAVPADADPAASSLPATGRRPRGGSTRFLAGRWRPARQPRPLGIRRVPRPRAPAPPPPAACAGCPPRAGMPARASAEGRAGASRPWGWRQPSSWPR